MGTLNGFWIKLVVTPFLFLVLDNVYGGIYYPSWWEPVVTGVVVALFGQLMELMFLQPGTLWFTTLLDMIMCLVVVFFSKFIFVGTKMGMDGVFFIAVFFGLSEYFLHLWLIRSGRVEKV
ncbi:hypothetical protein EEL32_15920 [Brevibacillus laterosporus]|nr:hypothetical protein [Brevibacillus laterosporus]TPG69191.1 hypothetical protein EEL31_12065 [Brevibacillus laterosporus]TPG84256.1 hypothetical protein EEL32_15920 [Brevibacillus laterosporus]